MILVLQMFVDVVEVVAKQDCKLFKISSSKVDKLLTIWKDVRQILKHSRVCFEGYQTHESWSLFVRFLIDWKSRWRLQRSEVFREVNRLTHDVICPDPYVFFVVVLVFKVLIHPRFSHNQHLRILGTRSVIWIIFRRKRELWLAGKTDVHVRR